MTDTLETLSSTQVTEIIGPIAVYGITKCVENIFEKNNIFQRREEQEDNETD